MLHFFIKLPFCKHLQINSILPILHFRVFHYQTTMWSFLWSLSSLHLKKLLKCKEIPIAAHILFPILPSIQIFAEANFSMNEWISAEDVPRHYGEPRINENRMQYKSTDCMWKGNINYIAEVKIFSNSVLSMTGISHHLILNTTSVVQFCCLWSGIYGYFCLRSDFQQQG